jgi:hypothetical protein
METLMPLTGFCHSASLRATLCSIILAALSLTPARAHVPDAERFVATFGEVCIPERLDFQGTLALAERLGWQKIVTGEDAATDRFVVNAREQIDEAAEDDDFAFEVEMAFFDRTIEGRRYLLSVDLVLSEFIDLLGCLIYDFAATEPIDAELVTRLLGQPIAYTTLGGDPNYAVDPSKLVGTVWGPAPSLPRTLDTSLSFVPVGSPVAAQTSFTGLVLKFSTSLPSWEERNK